MKVKSVDIVGGLSQLTRQRTRDVHSREKRSRKFTLASIYKRQRNSVLCDRKSDRLKEQHSTKGQEMQLGAGDHYLRAIDARDNFMCYVLLQTTVERVQKPLASSLTSTNRDPHARTAAVTHMRAFSLTAAGIRTLTLPPFSPLPPFIFLPPPPPRLLFASFAGARASCSGSIRKGRTGARALPRLGACPVAG